MLELAPSNYSEMLQSYMALLLVALPAQLKHPIGRNLIAFTGTVKELRKLEAELGLLTELRNT